MHTVEPFLFRFASTVTSPRRGSQPLDSYYDADLDVVCWLGSDARPPIVTVEGVAAPQTKKNDLEKGEDAKDALMWP